MLSLTRRTGETITLTLADGQEITIVLTHNNTKTARLAIDAPQEVTILRTELLER